MSLIIWRFPPQKIKIYRDKIPKCTIESSLFMFPPSLLLHMLPAFSPSSLLLRHIVFLEVLSRLPLSLMRVTYMRLGKSYLLIVYLYFSNWLSFHIFEYHWLLWCLFALTVFSFSFFFKFQSVLFTVALLLSQQNGIHYTRAGMTFCKLDKCYPLLQQLHFNYSSLWFSQLLKKNTAFP